MMYRILALFSTALLTSCATPSRQDSSLSYEPSLLIAKELRLPAETNYLSLDLNFQSFDHLRKELEGKLGTTLKHRGEAHITVITPPEANALAKKLPMDRILKIAESMDLKNTPYRPLCVGKGELSANGKVMQTYFVVIESEGLFKVRHKIYEEYLKKGGKKEAFDPELFYPHVTLGFTDRDLHYEEGVIKGASSCLYNLKPQP